VLPLDFIVNLGSEILQAGPEIGSRGRIYGPPLEMLFSGQFKICANSFVIPLTEQKYCGL
jgi:hypothetical protein